MERDNDKDHGQKRATAVIPENDDSLDQRGSGDRNKQLKYMLWR